MKNYNYFERINILSLPSLRCQAHWQNPQSQRYNQISPKSLPARPTPTHGLKENAAKIKDNITNDKNGQLEPGASCTTWSPKSIRHGNCKWVIRTEEYIVSKKLIFVKNQ